MEIKILNGQGIREIYERDMQRDFPKAELKPLKTILNLVEQKHYRCYGAFEEGQLCAYLFFVWEGRDLALLDYFAVLPEYRRMGIGARVLARSGDALAKEGFWGILFEIERISLAKDEAQKKQRMDRKKFYMRNGCRESGLKTEIFGTGYEILYLLLGEKALHCEQMLKFYEEIYHRMVKKESFAGNVVIHAE